jgi:hypothetical protein
VYLTRLWIFIMTDHPLAYVLGGSVRAQRLCPQIAAWVAQIGRARSALEIELVDLADWPLPLTMSRAFRPWGFMRARTRKPGATR